MPDLHVCVLQALPGRACEEEAEEEEEERIYSKLHSEQGGRRRKEEGGGSLFKSTAVTEEDAEWNWAKLAPRALGQGRGSR